MALAWNFDQKLSIKEGTRKPNSLKLRGDICKKLVFPQRKY